MSVAEIIPKQFDYSEAETRIYQMWEEQQVFQGKVDSSLTPFCVVIPPPNVTGILHMGHVLDNVPQDIMTRWHRMRGFAAVWIPGTDHAGIATQNVVKRQLDKEGISAADIGREAFVARVWEWREKHGDIIVNQLKRLGCSCDWSRERFTMDEQLSKAVITAFLHYYERGLIYKGTRMINWCPCCKTALADDEVEHQTRNSHLWHLRYPIVDENGQPTSEVVVVATTRPETMLGDTGVAVNPDDDRYKGLIGKQLLLPLQNRLIPVVADGFVDPAFGTGAVKVTPAHDPNDYQIGMTHGLAQEVVIGLDGCMTVAAGPHYSGLDRFEARKRVVEDLEALNFVEKIEPYTHSVGQCYRCSSVVEPTVSEQWFVKMKPLAEKAKQVVLDGKLKIVPDSEKHDYYSWMDNIQDWCISRQLWWGHRIPVYYCDDCKLVMAKAVAPSQCDRCSSKNITQDPDVLDTWFSSQLWPFSTLGWPDKTEELSFWYPNSWLMSGRDILPFWDARMITSGLELLGEIPFHTLVLHGLAMDEQGRKLSKSLGNSPDPLELFDKHGTDAIRAAIIQRYPMGRQDIRLNDTVYQEGRAFVTKVWNAFRLLMINLQDQSLIFDSHSLDLSALEDRWIVSRLNVAIREHDQLLAENDFSHALEAISRFFWNEYCDWYLEIIKPRMRSEGEQRNSALSIAFHCMQTLIKLLHPYVPFVTEEMWQLMRQGKIQDSVSSDQDRPCLALEPWPQFSEQLICGDCESAMQSMMSLVRGIRDVRHNLNLSPKQDLTVKVQFYDPGQADSFGRYQMLAGQLAVVSSFSKYDQSQPPKQHAPFNFAGGIGYVELPADLDLASLKKRLEGKVKKLEQGLAGAEVRLNNSEFISSAPPAVVEESRAKAQEYSQSIGKLREFLDLL